MRDGWAGERFEDGRGVVVGDGRGRNLRHIWRGRGVQAFGFWQVWCGGDAGCAGIAGILEKELNRAALHTGVGAVGAFGVFIAAEVAAVAGENDFAFDADAERSEEHTSEL